MQYKRQQRQIPFFFKWCGSEGVAVGGEGGLHKPISQQKYLWMDDGKLNKFQKSTSFISLEC